MDCKEVFKQLVRYIPDGENARLYNNMWEFGEACLAAGEFDEAARYADIVLAHEDKNENRHIAACRIKLFAKLCCRNNEEFRHCEAFNKDMPEFIELLAACGSKSASPKLASIIKLANDNSKTVEEDKKRREEEERRREEEERQRRLQKEEEERQRQQRREEVRRQKEMRLRQEKIEEEERQRETLRRAEQERERQRMLAVLEKRISIYTWACWSCFTFATLFFVAGIVLWSVFGDRMPYVFAGLGWLFVVALILYVAVFVFAGKKRRMEKQQEETNRQVERQIVKIAKRAKSETDGGYVVFIVGIVALMVVCIVAGILGAFFQ